jgi:hypothetical protein
MLVATLRDGPWELLSSHRFSTVMASSVFFEQ